MSVNLFNIGVSVSEIAKTDRPASVVGMEMGVVVGEHSTRYRA